MGYKISKAQLADVAALNALVNSAYRGESSRRGWTTEADFLDGIRIDPEGLREIMVRQHVRILKCTEGAALIGCVHLEKRGEQLYLGMLTVSPELQNRGIGKLLLAAAEEEARNLNCHFISMTVLSERTSLIAWYERHGYVNTYQKKPFPMDNPRMGLPKKFLEFVVMEKEVV